MADIEGALSVQVMHEVDDIAEKISEWAAADQSIAAVWLYGSRLKGKWHSDSDLDIALLPACPADEILDVYLCGKKLWKRQLSTLLGLTIDLELGHPDLAPNVWRYLQSGSREIFRRESFSLVLGTKTNG